MSLPRLNVAKLQHFVMFRSRMLFFETFSCLQAGLRAAPNKKGAEAPCDVMFIVI
jgi:hypothetical protein